MLTKKERKQWNEKHPKTWKLSQEIRESKAKSKCWVFQMFPLGNFKIKRTSKVKFTWAGGSTVRGSAALLFLCTFWRRVRRRLVLWGGDGVFETVVLWWKPSNLSVTTQTSHIWKRCKGKLMFETNVRHFDTIVDRSAPIRYWYWPNISRKVFWFIFFPIKPVSA